MARVSIGAAIGSGFALVGRRPLSVLAWGLPGVVLGAVAIWLLAPTYLAIVGMALRQAQSGAVAVNPAASPLMSQMMLTSGLIWLIDIVQVFVAATVACAVFRAVLHPEQRAFAYLRFGAPELMLSLMTFAALILFVVAMILVMIPVGLVVALAAAGSSAQGGGAAGLGVAVVIPLLVFALMIGFLLIALRFALVGPMIVDDGKFHLFESWAMTKGHVGALFAICLGLLAFAIAAEIVVSILMVALGAAGFFGVIGGTAGLPAFLKLSPADMIGRLAPLLAIYLVALVPIQGCFMAIFGAPWARAYHDLRPETSEVFA